MRETALKSKTLSVDMVQARIAKLEGEVAEEADHTQWCDHQVIDGWP